MTEKTPVIILIETSTSLCSAALATSGGVIAYRESDDPRAHASKLAVFIQEMLMEHGLSVKDCSAVAVSSGPGSYTGLRVGVSTAKGLCFGAGIPLISVGTLETLLWQAKDGNLIPEGCGCIVPMIDARRMEVYCCAYNSSAEEIMPVQAKILDSGSFSDIDGKLLFIGDGAEKFSGISSIANRSAFIHCRPKASSMSKPAFDKFLAGKFEDTAYFEPFYLKEFVATTSKKQILPR